MDSYFMAMDSLGQELKTWADPEGDFSGYTKGWAFTEFRTAITIAVAYVFFAVAGPVVMKGLPVIDPYPIKFAYNVSQIFLCAYMTIEAGFLAYRNGYTLTPCNDFLKADPPIANLLWLFYISKVWDFWDTVFIVLGKK